MRLSDGARSCASPATGSDPAMSSCPSDLGPPPSSLTTRQRAAPSRQAPASRRRALLTSGASSRRSYSARSKRRPSSSTEMAPQPPHGRFVPVVSIAARWPASRRSWQLPPPRWSCSCRRRRGPGARHSPPADRRSVSRPCSAAASPASGDSASGRSTWLGSPARTHGGHHIANPSPGPTTRQPGPGPRLRFALRRASSPRRRPPITLRLATRPTPPTSPARKTRTHKPLRPPDPLHRTRRASRSRPAPPSMRRASLARLALSSLRTDKEHR